MKTCPKCKLEKELQFFYKDKQTSDGFTCWCKGCKINHSRAYYALPNVAQQRKAYNQSYKERNPDSQKAAALKRLYNITLEDYDKMFSKQNGCCTICNRHQSEFKKALAVDHCHVTGLVRGLLCSDCNLILGNAQDKIEILVNAIDYLKYFQSQSKKG